MTVVLIEKERHDFMCKGEVKVYENVRAICSREDSDGFELIINKNWSVFGSFKYTRIEIL